MTKITQITSVFIVLFQFLGFSFSTIQTHSQSTSCSTSGEFSLRVHQKPRSGARTGVIQVLDNGIACKEYTAYFPSCKNGTCGYSDYGPRKSLQSEDTRIGSIFTQGDPRFDAGFYDGWIFSASCEVVIHNNELKKYCFSIHGTKSSELTPNSSHGCIRISGNDSRDLKRYLGLDSVISFSNSVAPALGSNSTRSTTNTNTQTPQPERSNLSTNGIIRKPRIPPITTTPRTTTPSTGSTPSNSGSDKPKQSCSAIQLEIVKINDKTILNPNAYSNWEQQISTRQAKIDNNQCT